MLGRLTALTTAVVLATTATPATGGEPAGGTPTTLTLDAPARYADAETPVRLTLKTDDGTPLAGQPVTLERRRDGDWRLVDTLITDEDGTATSPQTLARDAEANVVRATYAGDATHAGDSTGRVQLRMKRREGVVGISGPDRVVDERQVTLTVRWRTRNDTPVPGSGRTARRRSPHVPARTPGGGRRRSASTGSPATAAGSTGSTTCRPATR